MNLPKRPPCFRAILLVLLLLGLPVQAGKKGGFVQIHRGTLPLILSAPHGGILSLKGRAPRKNIHSLKNFRTLSDRYTSEIARGIAGEIKRITGREVYLVVNLLHRRYMDPNRKPSEAYEHLRAKQIYGDYHRAIQRAIQRIGKKYSQALLVDIHGQTRLPADVYLGSKRGKTLQSLVKKFGKKVWRGSHSLGGELAKRGYKIPGFSSSMIVRAKRGGKKKISLPRYTPSSLSGGAITQLYGSSKWKISAIQVEIHRRIRFSKKGRKRFIRDLARALVRFYKRFLK